MHYVQLVKSRRFCQYDHGEYENWQIYGRSTPPGYKLKNCRAKVALIYCDADTIVAAADVKRLSKKLPNMIKFHRVNDDTFNHVDYPWASDAKELVYNYIIDWMREVENEKYR